MPGIIETSCGKIRGVKKDGVILYKGIPYAEPPVGDLRWRPPVEKTPWEGVLMADDWKNKCMQPPNDFPPYGHEFYSDPEYERPMSEDCLYLHIWAPEEPGKYPVAIWIHGGAFITGYSSEIEFDGEAYARRGVILVSVEYRCNIFGFLCHPWLSKESPQDISGNYGILDQICAIRWVRDNINAFGGDPENITIFGQSAGAMSVQTLLVSPLAKGLMQRAILQSGGSYGEGLHTDLPLRRAEGYGLALSDLLGANSLAEMRDVDAETLLRTFPAFAERVEKEAGGLFLIPVIDGCVLKNGYYEAMDDGEEAEVPCLLGSTKDDILCSPGDEREDSVLYRGAVSFSRKLEESGREAAFVYRFARDLPGDDLGAWHSSELWYMFGTLGRCWRPFTAHDEALSEMMLDFWTAFMKTGDPNTGRRNGWRRCTAEDPFVMEFV